MPLILMSIMFKQMLKEDYNSTGMKSARRIVKVLPQKGKSVKSVDEKRKAMPSGKRISKTGKVYWETRKNRSDVRGTSV